MTLLRALVLVALCGILVSLLGFGVIAPRIVPDAENPFLPSMAIVLLNLGLGLVGGVGLVYYASLRQPQRTWRELGWHGDRLGSQVLWGVVGGLGICAALLVLLKGFGVPFGESLGQIFAYTAKQRLLFLLIGLVAAFIEESLFRGNLLPALSKRLGAPAALLLSAVIFAAYHLNFRPVSLIFKATAGLIYGALYLRHRALVSPAVAHALSWFIVGSL